MAAVSFYEAYVVVRHWQYSGVSCLQDQIYTTQAEAQQVADQDNEKHEVVLSSVAPECKVMSLIDFIDEQRREERGVAERERDHVGDY